LRDFISRPLFIFGRFYPYKTAGSGWNPRRFRLGLKPTLAFCPNFEEKFWDVIELYLDPPDKALVLCCDEKSQIQTLERIQPGVPLGIGHIRTQSHDYVRHGAVTLFTALDYLQGHLISCIEGQHRHQEWLEFLKRSIEKRPSIFNCI
jgi:hypothetical protein